MKKYAILPEMVCADRIEVTLDDAGIIHDVVFTGGCDGNAKGLARLLQGMPFRVAADKLEGVDCDGKGTSCPDQLARGLRDIATGLLSVPQGF